MAERGGFEPVSTLVCCCLVLVGVGGKTLEFQWFALQCLEISGSQQIGVFCKKGAKRAHKKTPDRDQGFFCVM